jgi:hypothetical protein
MKDISENWKGSMGRLMAPAHRFGGGSSASSHHPPRPLAAHGHYTEGSHVGTEDDWSRPLLAAAERRRAAPGKQGQEEHTEEGREGGGEER